MALRRALPLLELEYADPGEALGRALAASDHPAGDAAWSGAVALHHELLTAQGRYPADGPHAGAFAQHGRGAITDRQLDSYLFLHLVAIPVAGAPVDRAAVDWLGHCVEAAVLGGWRTDRTRWVAALFCDLLQTMGPTWDLDPASVAVDVGGDVGEHDRRILERCVGRLPTSTLRRDDDDVAALDARPDALWWRGRHPSPEHLGDLGYQVTAAGRAAPLCGVMRRGPDPLAVSALVLDISSVTGDVLGGVDRVSGSQVRLRIANDDITDDED